MNHHRAGRLLSAYVDSELTEADARAVREHLLDCPACREAHENLRATRELLTGLPPAKPPAEFWEAVREPPMRPAAVSQLGVFADRMRSTWRRSSRLSPRRLRFLRPGWVLAAVVVVLALAVIPLVKGTVDRLHATEIGVDLYVHDHALQMSTAPLVDRAYVGLVAGDAELVLAGETPRAGGDGVR